MVAPSCRSEPVWGHRAMEDAGIQSGGGEAHLRSPKALIPGREARPPSINP